MKIISWNVNGIRSVYKKNFPEWLEETDADIVCLQEIKAQEEEISTLFPETSLFGVPRYRLYTNQAAKKGYSGVAIFTKVEPLAVKNTLGLDRFDREGRMLELAYPDFMLFNLYIPHGGRQKENMDYKLAAYARLLERLRDLKGQEVILAGDFNVAHKAMDLAQPAENQDNTMFTPEERAQLDKLCELGFADSFRTLHPEDRQYTWWPYAVDARQRNLGWRIDYIFLSRELAPKLRDAFVLSKVGGSDHCPIGIEI